MTPELNELKRRFDALEQEFYRNNFSALQDFPKKSRFNTALRVPVFATAPTKCELGELYANSGTGKLYVCSATDTWTVVGTQS